MSKIQNIYLIGFMGSGKSTIGKPLAKAKKMQFIDLDGYIESQEKKSIADIFKTAGEENFRKIEAKALKTLSQQSNLIIATGGGTPCNSQNQLILKSGLVIYLECNLRTLTDRLYPTKSKRPLLNHCRTKSELYSFIRDTMIKRKSCYQSYTIKLKNNHSTKELINSLLQLI